MNEKRFDSIEDVPLPGPTEEQYVPLTWRAVAVLVGIWLVVALLSIGLIVLTVVLVIEKIAK